jgi:uncharacterized phage protein (TIGR01671 family)
MKPQIKFRCWDIRNSQWVEDNDFYVHSLTGKTHWADNPSGNYANLFPFDDDEFDLQQFTGRFDAQINGKEVYEGDIIENCDTKQLEVVYWNEDEAAWYCRYLAVEDRIVSLADSLGNLNKVIGNIYENAEMLQTS